MYDDNRQGSLLKKVNNFGHPRRSKRRMGSPWTKMHRFHFLVYFLFVFVFFNWKLLKILIF